MCRMLQIYSLCPFHEDGKKKPRNYFSSFRPYIHIRRCIFWHSLFSRFSPFVEGKTSSSPLGSSIKKSFGFVSHSSSFMSSKKKKKAMGLFVCAKLENQRDDIDLGVFIKTICSNFNGVKAAQVISCFQLFKMKNMAIPAAITFRLRRNFNEIGFRCHETSNFNKTVGKSVN